PRPYAPRTPPSPLLPPPHSPPPPPSPDTPPPRGRRPRLGGVGLRGPGRNAGRGSPPGQGPPGHRQRGRHGGGNRPENDPRNQTPSPPQAPADRLAAAAVHALESLSPVPRAERAVEPGEHLERARLQPLLRSHRDPAGGPGLQDGLGRP